MAFGLRAGDSRLLLDLAGGDRRLFMRLGHLMQQHRSCTEAVLGECGREPGLRQLLLDRAMVSCTPDTFAELVARHGCGDVGLVLHEDREGSDTWLVVALEDELDNPLLAGDQDAAATGGGEEEWHAPVSELLPSLHATVRRPVESLLAAQADDQRAAALEQLRYAAPPMTVVAELMPLLLADGADVVRERAIALLVAVGVHPMVVDLMRALQRGDDATVERLAEQLPRDLPFNQTELLLAALITVLGNAQIGPGVIALATRMAEPLARHRGLVRFLELICVHAGALAITDCVRALQSHEPAAVNRVLQGMLGNNPALDARLIVLLAMPGCRPDSELMTRGIHLLLSPEEEPADRMALAHALRRLDTDGELAHRLCGERHRFTGSRDSTVFWLLADLARSGAIRPADGDGLAEAIADILNRGQGPHLVAILDQQLPNLLPCEAPQRAALVEPLAEMAIRYKDERSRDLIEFILSQMGEPAVEPLWQLAQDHPQVRVRTVAIRVLPHLLIATDARQRPAAVRRLLACADSEDQHQGRLACVAAAAALLVSLDADDEAVATLTEEVDQRCENYGIQAIEAQAQLAAGAAIAPERRSAILDKMLRLLTAELPHTTTNEERDPTTEEITYILDPQLGTHTDLVPRVLGGLLVLSGSPCLPSPMLRRTVQTLIELWRKVSGWEIIWGPGNIAELAVHMGRIGQLQQCPDTLRKQIAQSLLPRCTHLTVARVLVPVLASGQGGGMASLAATCSQRLIRSASRNEYADDELPDLVDVLSMLLALPSLGEADGRLRGQLVSLITSNRQNADKRTRDRLRFLRDELPASVARRLDWV